MALAVLRDRFPGVPRIALTATADLQTRADLLVRLEMEDAEVYTTSADRPNIRYAIVQKDNPRRQLLAFLRRHQGSSGIVYCLSRRKVEETATFLEDNGIRALPYHAGLDRAVRDANQDAFLKEEGLVLVATIAFGMGIDKPDVRFVAHLDLPSSVEAYYQETGRAGRDGLPSEAWMAYGLSDMALRGRMIDEREAPDDVKRIERAKLGALLGVCETAGCRRQALLAYFGERHPGQCGNCDTCEAPVDTWDGTVAAQKILSAMVRTGQRYGAGHVIDVLRGETTEKVTRAGHDRLPTFGVGKDIEPRVWQSAIRQLVAAGIVRVDHDEHGALVATEEARAVLKGDHPIRFRRDRVFKATEGRGRGGSSAPVADLSADEQALFEALRAERLKLAREQGVPPYVVFHDTTLREMARLRPMDLDTLGRVPGVGEAKLRRYGDAMLEVIYRGVGG